MALRTRHVISNVDELGGGAAAGRELIFRLVAGSLTPDTVILSGEVRYVVPSNGQVDVVLWCNEDGLVSSYYEFVTPDTAVQQFSLPYEDGSPVELPYLILFGATPGLPTYASLYNAVQNLISVNADALLAGVIGDAVDEITSEAQAIVDHLQGSVSITVGPVAPTSPQLHDLWVETA